MNVLTCEYNGKQRVYIPLCEDDRNPDRGTVRGYQLEPEEGIRSYRVEKMVGIRDYPEVVVDMEEIRARIEALGARQQKIENEAYEKFMQENPV